MRLNEKSEDFDGLLAAWLNTLDTEALNMRFYGELFGWFNRAVAACKFPDGKNEEQVMRMITRLLFIWFVKEKGLAPERLFTEQFAREMLRAHKPDSSDYYQAVLQNLFFGTLNTPPGKRRFRRMENGKPAPEEYRATNLCRYRDLLKDPQAFVGAVDEVPFVNGGLFDCLDPFETGGDRPDRLRVDCFTDNKTHRKLLGVPARLFFDDEKGKAAGLFAIFNKFKFTVSENTPLEEEVALDPELLGLVFENLLAAIVPESRDSARKDARKETGSFYTPRPIVDYMTDEAIIAYFRGREKMRGEEWDGRLRKLVSWQGAADEFSEDEKDEIIAAVTDMKMLDPAAGSGAFPMGMLHKLVHILDRVDPQNKKWKRAQLALAKQLTHPTARDDAVDNIERVFSEKNNFGNYGRKLFLIKDVIHGADIQSVAVQIARLRFFISLMIDQKPRDGEFNRGIAPLPNLETNFVAADTLMALARKGQGGLEEADTNKLMTEIERVRRDYFGAQTRAEKHKLRKQDAKLRGDLAKALEGRDFGKNDAKRVANWDLYDQTASADWFDPEFMLGVRNGFDIVIGNPPYVRADAGAKHLAYRKKLQNSEQYKTLHQKWDLYVPFMERGFQLLAPNGVESFIISDAYCRSVYGKKSREWFLQNSAILRLDFYTPIKIFKAGVHNLSFLVRNAEGRDNTPLRRLHNNEFGNVELLPAAKQNESDEKIYAYDNHNSTVISSPVVSLREICYVSYGMAVNNHETFHEKFITSDVLSDTQDEEHPIPFVLGKDFDNFCYKRLRFLEWGTPRAPDGFRRKTFPELHNAPEKILALCITGAQSVKLFYDNEKIHFNHASVGFVPWHGLAGVKNTSLKKSARYLHQNPREGQKPREELEETSRRFSLLYLCGIMASDAARKILAARRRSNIHLYPNDWKNLPIPDVSAEEQKPIIELVRKMTAAKRANPAADISKWQSSLNKKAAALYGIPAQKETPAEPPPP